ncbi:MAG: peptidyl-prolyl cis-trans isomerase [Verrucomicrobia bacterium]|nr:peptidyl-prolyl cis-trans isomerase [Verrucomicrobiota bacterium]
MEQVRSKLSLLSAVFCAALIVLGWTAPTCADPPSDAPQKTGENTDTIADSGEANDPVADPIRTAGDPVMVDAVYLIVDTRVITFGEVFRKSEPIVQRILDANPNLSASDANKLRAQVFAEVADGMVTRALILKAAQEKGLNVDEARVGSQIKRILLAEGLTIEQYLEKYKMTYRGLFREVQDDILYAGFRQIEIAPRVNISPSEIGAYYEAHKDDEEFVSPAQVHAHEIVLMGSDLAKSRAKAEEALQLLRNGAAFDVVARKYSENPRVAQTGGDLGWITRNVIGAPKVNKALFEDLDVGVVSDIIQDDNRFLWIVMASGRREASRTPLHEAYAAIEARLRRIKLEEETRKYAFRLRKTTAIVDPNGVLR